MVGSMTPSKPFRPFIRGPVAAILTAGLIALAACSGDTEQAYVDRPVEDLYNISLDQLAEGDYTAAAIGFDEVERQHPYSIWATKAQLMAAYSHYASNAYTDAVLAADRFIQLHPSNRDTPYAYYLKAISYYEQIIDVGRDQLLTAQAQQSLGEVMRRFPDSDYARDATLKMDLVRDHLAGKEIEVGRFYQRRGDFLAALGRFQVVVQNYQTTTHVPEALHRINEVYSALGIEDQAERTAAVLGYNHPGSEWYIDSYELTEGVTIRPPDQNRGFLSRTWNWLF